VTDTDRRQLVADMTGMLRIRRFEERVRDLRLAGDIVGSVHLCIGQEAGPVGACSVLAEQDAVFATYRGHGWAIARGVPLEPLFAELLGRESGICGGRGGSAYFTAPQFGFYGENSIVGAGAPIALGAALAGRHDGSGRVAVTVFGDGAMNQGSVHEALNFAAAFELPVVFICENNTWSELTPIADMVAEPELWKRAAGYGMHGYRLDGNDPAAVREFVTDAVESARDGEGPVLLELMTERLVGHYIGDAEQYRRPGELEQANAREPLVRIRQALLASGASADDLAVIEAAVAQEIDVASARALPAPLADPTTLKEHLYA
jgi:TPP-dependent pyruvate/acetoin dehydrogenase alpha subunit